jgi:hypothetical protein
MTDADTMNWVSADEVGRRLDIDPVTADRLGQHLVGHYLAGWKAMQGLMAITAHGIDAAEEELRRGVAPPILTVRLGVETECPQATAASTGGV